MHKKNFILVLKKGRKFMLKRMSAKKKFQFRKYFILSFLTVFCGILLLIFVTDSAAHKNQSYPPWLD